ncbi:MAG: D-alanyl-D-alanine carboxypeptidase/D-alanyl-D-alanine-endopeptidase [Duncaniella sp.]|nr:D-alanyl-D-alanine carboxypeptidase/D-alanyl-D-alanine-endopeptidase [Duncaniella sp.]
MRISAIIQRTFCLVAASLSAIASSAFPLDISGIDTTRTAIYIEDLRFGVPIVAENIDVSLVPASIMKSVTVASALAIGDPEERFVTPVTAVGNISPDGTLDGNIIVTTSGDPSIESSFLDGTHGFCDSIVTAVVNTGITAINGDIVIKEEGFEDDRVPAGWMDEDVAWPYGAGHHGANFRDNRFTLRLPSRETIPYVPDLDIRIVTRGKKQGLKATRNRDTETFTFTGRVPRRGYSDRLAMPRPAKVMRHEIIEKLRTAGIEVRQSAVKPEKETILLYTHLSPTFREIMRSLMFRSDNMMAEGMLRALRPGGSRADAVKEELAVWSDAGISLAGINIEDGSGLSRNDRLTARFLADVLKTMTAPDYSDDYTSLFPRAGYEGTVRNFLAGTHLEWYIALKTGSMRGVQSFAGYKFDEEGRPTHLIIFIVNGFTCNRATLKNAISRLLLEKFPLSLQLETLTEPTDL